MAYAAPIDVADQWRPLSDAEGVTATVLLGRVSALIRLRHPDMDARVAADPDYATVVAGISVDAVLRVLRNPDGKVQESIDDYTYRRADAVSDGVLYVTDAEWALLTPGSVSNGAFTIRPGGL